MLFFGCHPFQNTLSRASHRSKVLDPNLEHRNIFTKLGRNPSGAFHTKFRMFGKFSDAYLSFLVTPPKNVKLEKKKLSFGTYSYSDKTCIMGGISPLLILSPQMVIYFEF